jgi:hypothetical protein
MRNHGIEHGTLGRSGRTKQQRIGSTEHGHQQNADYILAFLIVRGHVSPKGQQPLTGIGFHVIPSPVWRVM